MRRTIVLLAAMAAMVVVYAGAALAAAVSEVEPNDSIAQAQNIDASFDTSQNADIASSTDVPNATVNGTGNGSLDFYKFTVPAGDPARVILDIDHTTPPGSYDSMIELYDSGGVRIGDNDDDGADSGSTVDGNFDSRIGTTLDPGTYYVGVGSFSGFGPVPAGATYQLHVSVGNDDTTPPDTTITAGPAEGSTVNPGIATFSFSAAEESSFECRLDQQVDFTSCGSTETFTGLSLGSHTLEVRATDSAGNVDSTPASRTWIVSDATAPTVQSITPPQGATKVSRTNPNITATFSEEMVIPAGSFTLQKVRVQGQRETVLGPVSATVQNPADQSTPNVVRLAPSVTLDKGSYYRVRITTAATDLIGNPLQSATTWRFKTAPQ